MYISILIPLLIITIGSYLIWPSKYNIPAHLALAFIPVQYIIPTLILPNIISDYDQNIIELYTNILWLGAIFYILGLFIGNYTKNTDKNNFAWNKTTDADYCKKIINLTKNISIYSIVGLIFCFIVMGFVPAFASDPLSAKFFKGEYATPYSRVAIIFRISHFILQFTIPLLLVIWYYSKQYIYLLLTFISVVLLAVCLTRGPAFSGLLMGGGIIIAYKNKFFTSYITLLFLIYSVGSSMFYLVGILTGAEHFMITDQDSSIYQVMSDGSPDVKDQLQLLTAFHNNSQYTYGRTFLGGLIPNNYIWNPSVWTLSVVNDTTDISDIRSGGFRLPLPMWGYVSFSWLGVILLSLINGILSSFFIRKTKQLLAEKNNVLIQAIIILVYIKVFDVIINFHLLNMYAIPIILVMCMYMYNITIVFGKKRII